MNGVVEAAPLHRVSILASRVTEQKGLARWIALWRSAGKLGGLDTGAHPCLCYFAEIF